jgi:hypothetical protein
VKDPRVEVIVGFIQEIGLSISEAKLSDPTFLPGILVKNGGLVIDPAKLAHPGDLLHEAGHLAVVPADDRSALNGQVDLEEGPMEPVEAQAIAWSYAAALHLGLDPRVVFHSTGYMGMAERLLMNFELGVYIGVAGLADAGLTITPREAFITGAAPYPAMLRWLRGDE